MADLNLEQLGLHRKYRKLHALQKEVADLDARHRQADGECQQLMRKLEESKQLDLNRQAEALRAGTEPHGEAAEPTVRRELENKERNRSVFLAALQQAQGELAQHMSRHSGELFKDVAAKRAEFAREVSELARAALPAYQQYRELAYTLRAFEPPPDTVPGDNLPTILGVHTRTSGEPERGTAEQWLGYFIGIAPPAEQAASDTRPGEAGDSEAGAA